MGEVMDNPNLTKRENAVQKISKRLFTEIEKSLIKAVKQLKTRTEASYLLEQLYSDIQYKILIEYLFDGPARKKRFSRKRIRPR